MLVISLMLYHDETFWHNKPYANNARDLYLLIMLTGIRLDEGQSVVVRGLLH